MENLFENRFLRIDYSKERCCLYHLWKSQTIAANWENMKNGFLKYIETIESLQPVNVIVDEREMEYVFSPAEQEWIDSVMTPRAINAGTKRIAIVTSKYEFVEIATKLMMDEGDVQKLGPKFTKTIEEAEAWVEQQNILDKTSSSVKDKTRTG